MVHSTLQHPPTPPQSPRTLEYSHTLAVYTVHWEGGEGEGGQREGTVEGQHYTSRV
jgi:hypothetical protein